MKNQILNVKSYQQVVQFAADLVAPTARKQWYSLPRTDWYSFPRNEWYSLTRILHLIGQFSSASIKHYEYSNNKWKKAKANMGIYNFTPMRFNTIGCDGDIDDVSEIGSPNSPFTRVWKNVSKTKNVGVYHSRSIKSNERFTKFYIDGNLVKQLNNIW